MSDEAVEVVSWNPDDHTDLPGFAHGLSRYGGHWFDVGVSIVPGEADALEALDKVFAKLKEIVLAEAPSIQYFSVDVRVASGTPVPHPR
ncbi:hypothetical protein [Mycobacterium sp. shizuoka-1]|uniref:hypothetical protein n=1 Tax=Mycobacterium sp. shizuoka-1 TaxID=2039281 RepID=UPI001157B248|nr:hypothetical protein [Mycobacterium sp. shizuoka-1]